jgi:DNA-binding NarL/FixJ family response regulator
VDLPARRVARNLIEKQANWAIVGEASVHNALESARRSQADVIVLDDDALSGKAVPFISRMLPLHPSSKLLVLTSHSSEHEIRALLKAGATGLLAKSEFETKFVSAVKHIAAGQRFLSGQLARTVLRRFLDSAIEHTDTRPALSDLTPRELEIVRLISLGNGNKQVAAHLGIAVRTAEVHRANAMRKLNLHNLAELVHLAVSTGLIELHSGSH